MWVSNTQNGGIIWNKAQNEWVLSNMHLAVVIPTISDYIKKEKESNICFEKNLNNRKDRRTVRSSSFGGNEWTKKQSKDSFHLLI